MDRKGLLLEEAASKRELTRGDEQKLKKAVEDGGIFLTLVSSPGWKKLVDEFINLRTSQERYLVAKAEDLADIRAAQRELFDLLRFVKNKIGDGQKSFEMLRDSK